MWEREKEGRCRHLYQHPEADFHKSCAVVGGIDWVGVISVQTHWNRKQLVSGTHGEIQFQTLSSPLNKKQALVATFLTKRQNEKERKSEHECKEEKRKQWGNKREKSELKVGRRFTQRLDSRAAVSPCYVIIRHQLSVQEWDNNSTSVSHVRLSICQRLLFD